MEAASWQALQFTHKQSANRESKRVNGLASSRMNQQSHRENEIAGIDPLRLKTSIEQRASSEHCSQLWQNGFGSIWT